ncbi:citryl-CoA lyase [Sphingomonas aquatilis NBRC 16722]|uniref:Citrate lyase subunit beta/citryl-CoA lyase n=1 Tax=Sphingomonas aquatilis TaxID=93063 RepID=A0AAW3TRY5_9SPHN|nr:CoA ester lyase [Sphingomonas aquatilis]MBB3875948.1 citrate lyase subunit beta/citryl-CoA lyase [Sphingomonas aquatilis]GEM72603.1 citryl-CoA lyase [Sphingomonas aquatilis NBRC 16722]
MRLRSLLFVPGDRPERFAKAAASGADAIILDLEDSVAIPAKAAAREAVARYLAEPADLIRFVRVNPLGSGDLDADLAAARGADGVMLPKAEGAKDIAALVARMGDAIVPILPVATETPRAVFALGGYDAVAERLAGLTWGAEDLPAAIGASAARESDGRYTQPYEVVRTLALMGAHAAGVAAIETVYPAIRDADGLAAYAARGARDGFTGMMAIHPTQVAAINAAFTPGEQALADARAVVAAFAAAPGAGALQLDGRMIDAPHLKQARALLARAGEVQDAKGM